VFIFNTTLLAFPNVSTDQVVSVGATLLGMVALCAAWWGWLYKPLDWPKRAAIGAAGAAMLVWAAIPP
jgi:TRAP-type uncharacterized transport system fused permease subunit